MNDALRMELSSAMKYLDWSFRVFGPSRKPVVEHFMEEAMESIGHARLMGDKIVALGGTPVVNVDVPKEKPKTVDAMLKLAVENEKAAIGIYTKLLGMVEDEPHMRVLFENQIAEEQGHLEEITKMRKR